MEKINNIRNFDGTIINNIKIYKTEEKFELQDLFYANLNDKERVNISILNAIKLKNFKILGNNGFLTLDKSKKKVYTNAVRNN
jgi:hypothetical protein